MYFRPNSVKIHGVLYTPGVVVRVGCSDGSISYNEIKSIYVYKDVKLFVVSQLFVESFIEHYRSFRVSTTSDISVVLYEDFHGHEVLHCVEKTVNILLWIPYIAVLCNYNHLMPMMT